MYGWDSGSSSSQCLRERRVCYSKPGEGEHKKGDRMARAYALVCDGASKGVEILEELAYADSTGVGEVLVQELPVAGKRQEGLCEAVAHRLRGGPVVEVGEWRWVPL